MRIEGVVENCPGDGSLFAARENRLGALASRQSQVVASREILDERFAQLAAQYPDDNIPMPKSVGWLPAETEFAGILAGSAGPDANRLRYRLQKGCGWILDRLEP